MEVCRLWGEGLRRQGIAKELAIRPETVSAVLWKVQKKLGTETCDEAYQIAKEEIEAYADWVFTERRRRVRIDANKPVLTDMQKEVLSRKAKGQTVAEIAEDLAISQNTVYVHLENCRERLGRTTTEEAIKDAKEIGYT